MIKMKIYALVLIGLLLSCCAQVQASSQLPAFFQIQKMRQRDPVSLIKEANRILEERDPEMIREKYKKMKKSPFVFYRTTAYLFYRDLAFEKGLRSPVQIPIQGDLHLENMSTYLTANHQIAYDLNDFDEAVSASYTWDLARCAVSIQLAAHENGFNDAQREHLVVSYLNRYQFYLRELLRRPQAIYEPLIQNASPHIRQAIQEATGQSREAFLAEVAPQGRFDYSKKIQAVSPEIAGQVKQAIGVYGNREPFFNVKDVAVRIAGKASLGRYRYVVLIEGKSHSPQDDRILEIKEAALPSVGKTQANQALRIIRAIQYFLPQSDPLLGHIRLHDIDMYIKEWSPKAEVDLKSLTNEQDMEKFLDTVALITARAHARSGRTPDILKDLEQRLKPLKEFAPRYKQQVEQDFDIFKKSILEISS